MHVGTFNLLHVDIDLKQNCFKATVNTKHVSLHIIMYFFSELQWYLKKTNKQTTWLLRKLLKRLSIVKICKTITCNI